MSERLAAVAIVFSKEGGSLLLIERAEREGDPWSGQIAFPGGKMQAGDTDMKGVAVREAREELAITLDSDAEFLGYLRPFRTHTGDMEVVPSVFVLTKEVVPKPNGEVASFKWIGLKALEEGKGASLTLEREGGLAKVPAYSVDGYTIWGLTHRIIMEMLGE